MEQQQLKFHDPLDNHYRNQHEQLFDALESGIDLLSKAGHLNAAIATLFKGYAMQASHNIYFSGGQGLDYYAEGRKTNVLAAIISDLSMYKGFNRLGLKNGRSYSINPADCPIQILQAVDAVRADITRLYYPEAMGLSMADLTENEAMMLPIKIGNALYAFAPNDEGELTAQEIRVRIFSHPDGNTHLRFDFCPEIAAARESYGAYNGSKDKWFMYFTNSSYSSSEYSRNHGSLHIPASAKNIHGVGYTDEVSRHDDYRLPETALARLKHEKGINSWTELISQLTPATEQLKAVWNALPDYRDIWFLPNVVRYYGQKHLNTMRTILPELATYAVALETPASDGVGFWSD